MGAVLSSSVMWANTSVERTRLQGSKWTWTVVSFINFAGPISYFALGRRRVS
jgi:hypothetical protein